MKPKYNDSLNLPPFDIVLLYVLTYLFFHLNIKLIFNSALFSFNLLNIFN